MNSKFCPPLTSIFRDLSQVPLPEDPPIEEVHQGGQARAEEDSPNFRELLKEIEAHTTNVDVIDVGQPKPSKDCSTPRGSVRSEVVEDTPDPAPLVIEQSPNLAPPLIKQSLVLDWGFLQIVFFVFVFVFITVYFDLFMYLLDLHG